MSADLVLKLWRMALVVNAIATSACVVVHWHVGRTAGRFRFYTMFCSSCLLVENVLALTVIFLPGAVDQHEPIEMWLRLVGRSFAALGMGTWAAYMMGIINGIHDKENTNG